MTPWPRSSCRARARGCATCWSPERSPSATASCCAPTSLRFANAAPDGYTLLVNSSAHTVNPSIYPNLTYDTAKDLMAISRLVQQPNILVVSPAKGWKTVGDLVKAAKAEPGKITFASAGTGSGTHMNAEKFRISAGIDALHIPYKGT